MQISVIIEKGIPHFLGNFKARQYLIILNFMDITPFYLSKTVKMHQTEFNVHLRLDMLEPLRGQLRFFCIKLQK